MPNMPNFFKNKSQDVVTPKGVTTEAEVAARITGITGALAKKISEGKEAVAEKLKKPEAAQDEAMPSDEEFLQLHEETFGKLTTPHSDKVQAALAEDETLPLQIKAEQETATAPETAEELYNQQAEQEAEDETVTLRVLTSVNEAMEIAGFSTDAPQAERKEVSPVNYRKPKNEYELRESIKQAKQGNVLVVDGESIEPQIVHRQHKTEKEAAEAMALAKQGKLLVINGEAIAPPVFNENRTGFSRQKAAENFDYGRDQQINTGKGNKQKAVLIAGSALLVALLGYGGYAMMGSSTPDKANNVQDLKAQLEAKRAAAPVAAKPVVTPKPVVAPKPAAAPVDATKAAADKAAADKAEADRLAAEKAKLDAEKAAAEKAKAEAEQAKADAERAKKEALKAEKTAAKPAVKHKPAHKAKSSDGMTTRDREFLQKQEQVLDKLIQQ